MNKSIPWVFLGISIAFFLFIVGLTGYRIEDTRTRNTLLVREGLPALQGKVSAVRNTYVDLGASSAHKDLRAVFDAEPRLLLLCIHSPSDGIQYLLARSRDYLKTPAELSTDWRGIPTYQTSRGYEVVLSGALGDEAEAVTMDAMFVIMGREDLYPILRDDLFLFLAFLLVSGVIILIALSVQDVPPTMAGGGGGFRRDDAYRPAERELGPGAGKGPAAGGPAASSSGLVRAEHFLPKLSSELERAAAVNQDLALARLRIDEPLADSNLPVVYGEIAGMLLQAFHLPDCLFESGNDAFSVILPSTDVDAAVKSMETFRKRVAGMAIEGLIRSLSIGVSSRAGRLISGHTLLEEADVSLAKASREGGNRVIGFRADPSLYTVNLPAS